MKNNTLLLIILFITTLSFTQTNFKDGFNTGYKKGYCQDQGPGCIEPIPPISPIPKVGESTDSYTDGYNRGFQMGLTARKPNPSSPSTSDRTRYQTAESNYVDEVMYEAPVNLMISALENLSRKAEDNLRIGNYEGVLENTKSMINIYSDFDYAYFLGSYAYDQLGQLANSYNYAMKAKRLNLERHGHYSSTIHEKMRIELTTLMSDNRFNDVIYLTESFWYTSDLGNLFKALGYYYKKDFNKSAKYFKKIKNNDTAKDYLDAIKYKYYIPNPYTKPKQEIKNTSGTKNEDDFFNEAQELYQKKEFDKVIEKLKPIEEKIRHGTITDKKTLLITYTMLAYSHYNKNNLAETIKYTTHTIDNSPTNEIGDFYYLRGISKSNIGDYYGSNKDYDYLIDNDHIINYRNYTLATLYNNKAYNLILLQKYKEAEPIINKAISLGQNTDYIWETKGELDYYLGNYSDAVKAMSISIKIKPTAISYYFRGLAEIELGNKEKGCADLSKAGEMGETKAYDNIKNKCN